MPAGGASTWPGSGGKEPEGPDGQSVPRSPRVSALFRMKAMTLATCSSSGKPSSAAPRRRSSRDTARANALSFIRLSTETACEVQDAFGGADERGSGDESGHFVACV